MVLSEVLKCVVSKNSVKEKEKKKHENTLDVNIFCEIFDKC